MRKSINERRLQREVGTQQSCEMNTLQAALNYLRWLLAAVCYKLPAGIRGL